MSKTLGKDFESRELSKKVRDLALQELADILDGTKKVDKRYRQAIVLKLAGAVLPRLTELTGGGVDPLILRIEKETAESFDIDANPKTSRGDKKQVKI